MSLFFLLNPKFFARPTADIGPDNYARIYKSFKLLNEAKEQVRKSRKKRIKTPELARQLRAAAKEPSPDVIQKLSEFIIPDKESLDAKLLAQEIIRRLNEFSLLYTAEQEIQLAQAAKEQDFAKKLAEARRLAIIQQIEGFLSQLEEDEFFFLNMI